MRQFCVSVLALSVLLGLLTACQQPVPGTGFSSAGSGGDMSPPPVQSEPVRVPDQSLSPPDQSVPPEQDPKQDPDLEPDPVRHTRLYVLMYHHFIQEGQEYNDWMLTDTRFREDLQWLTDHGYTTVLPSELAAGKALPEKAVMLTFDDGYDSNYTLAYPLLQEFQAKAVISIIVKNTEEQKAGGLTWAMCREMIRSGLVEIGSHTYNLHKEMPGIGRHEGESRGDYEARVLPDLQTSIDIIQANLGTKPLFFAYPYGITDAWASDFVREHFAVTVTTSHGVADISNGLYDLRRCNVSMSAPVSKYLPE